MTNAQKSLLRWIIRNGGKRTDKDIADDVECHVATVRKYRRALAPEGAE